MKILQISHTDLDGKMSIVVGKVYAYIKGTDFEYKMLDTEEMEQMIDIIKDSDADTIIISDLGIDEKIAKAIQEESTNGKDILYFDHHVPKCDFNEYTWAHVYTSYNDIKQCGASVMYRVLFLNGKNFKITDYNVEQQNILFKLSNLVEETRMYDTYQWYAEHHISARDLSRLSTIDYRFIENKFIQLLDTRYHSDIFKDYEREALDKTDKEIKAYVLRKTKQVHLMMFEGYVTAIVYASQYHNELGSHLYDSLDNIDLVAMIDTNKQKVSMRSNKRHVNLAKIAIKYGGGGHKSAAGFSYVMTNKMKIDFFDKLIAYKNKQGEKRQLKVSVVGGH